MNENKHTKHTKVKVQTIMKLNLIPIGFSLAVATALGVSTLSSHAQVSATATFTDTPGTGSDFDYTVTLQNTGSQAIGSFWMGWYPFGFDVTSPTAAANSLGWNNSVVNNSVEYGATSTALGGTETTFLGAGDSATFTFDSTTTPTELEDAVAGNGLAGESTVYSSDVDAFSTTTLTPGTDVDVIDLTPQTVPEPSSFAFFGAGLIAFLFVLRRKQSFAATRGQ
ncbi:MAG: PEP-CTERM sorting domain-containing protein [Verrucomicrobiota bacterium]